MKEMRFRKIDEEVIWKKDREVYKELFEDSQKECMRYVDKYLQAHDKVIELTERVRELEDKINKPKEDKYGKQIEEVYNYWNDMMPMMAMEEAGEFIQAVSKMERANILEHKDNLVKEMADMMISIKALTFRYDIEDDEIFEAIDKKLEKNY